MKNGFLKSLLLILIVIMYGKRCIVKPRYDKVSRELNIFFIHFTFCNQAEEHGSLCQGPH